MSEWRLPAVDLTLFFHSTLHFTCLSWGIQELGNSCFLLGNISLTTYLPFCGQIGIWASSLNMHYNSVWWLWIHVFPLWLQLRAFEEIWLGLTGTAASSSVQSQVLVEGIVDQKEKVKIAASKGKQCFQGYVGYLKGTYLHGQCF